LLVFVAGPMTAAAVASVRDLRYASELVMGAGLLMLAWIAVEMGWLLDGCREITALRLT
jgi:hypothetical protein